jgi:hypothetical protein
MQQQGTITLVHIACVVYMNNNPEFTHQLQEQYGHNNNGHQQQQQNHMQMEPHFMSRHENPYRYGGSQGHGQGQEYMSVFRYSYAKKICNSKER